MAFFSPTSSSFTAISQPKMRQEGFHLPSPSPSAGHPPSPPPGPFDLFLAHSSHHAHQGANSNNSNNNGSSSNNNNNNNGNGNSNGLPSLALPDAFSRTSAMDLTDELAMSLMNPASPATSNERSTHTPPAHHHNHGGEQQQTHMHNIFDISAPHASHFANTGAGGHAFSLPHTSHRPDLPPLSQPASLATSHLHGHYDHHTGNYHHSAQNGFLGGRDPFPAHFNSTIPPLSSHHDPHPQSLALSASGANDLTDPFGPFTPTSASSIPARESASPQPLGGGRRRAGSRSATGGGRSPSRSRSRVRPGTASSQSQQNQSQAGGAAGGPTRTTKSASRRRDSFTLPPHLQHSHSHSHSMGHNQTHLGHHLHSLPSPPLGGGGSAPRPSSIVIPPHGGPGGALSPLGNMGGLGSALSPLGPGPGHMNGNGIGQASGWFGVNEFKGVNGVNINGMGNGGGHGMGANPGSAPGGAEFSLPTPDSVGHGPFGTFGTSVGSMGISPKDTVTSGVGKDEQNGHVPQLDPASKQAAIVNEKRRRRRESHNAVERRRRDNINEKISELATLIPEVMLDPSAVPSSSTGMSDDKKDKDGDADGDVDCMDEKPSSASAKAKAAKAEKAEKEGAAAVKANKGMILRKSVEYIRYLQQLVGAQAARNRALEARLAQAGLAPSSPLSATHPQADDMSGLFGAEGLHAFDDRMDLGMGMGLVANGMGGFAAQFGGLEPMAEMDMDMDIEGAENGFGRAEVNGKHAHAGASPSDAGDDREGDEHEHDQEHDQEQGSGSPVSASDASSPTDRRDASTDRSEERSSVGGGSGGGGGSEREERGRRGRDGKVPLPVPKSPPVSANLTGRAARRRSKLVAVKEEGTGMEV